MAPSCGVECSGSIRVRGFGRPIQPRPADASPLGPVGSLRCGHHEPTAADGVAERTHPEPTPTNHVPARWVTNVCAAPATAWNTGDRRPGSTAVGCHGCPRLPRSSGGEYQPVWEFIARPPAVMPIYEQPQNEFQPEIVRPRRLPPDRGHDRKAIPLCQLPLYQPPVGVGLLVGSRAGRYLNRFSRLWMNGFALRVIRCGRNLRLIG